MISIFLPTTPNPTSGFFLVLPEEDTIPLSMSVEEAFKLLISGGVVEPGGSASQFPFGKRQRNARNAESARQVAQLEGDATSSTSFDRLRAGKLRAGRLPAIRRGARKKC